MNAVTSTDDAIAASTMNSSPDVSASARCGSGDPASPTMAGSAPTRSGSSSTSTIATSMAVAAARLPKGAGRSPSDAAYDGMGRPPTSIPSITRDASSISQITAHPPRERLG